MNVSYNSYFTFAFHLFLCDIQGKKIGKLEKKANARTGKGKGKGKETQVLF